MTSSGKLRRHGPQAHFPAFGFPARQTLRQSDNVGIRFGQASGPRTCRFAAQMAAVHIATMTFARRLAHVETIPQQDSASNAFNKLTRTFAAQMSALKDYRSRGEQRMTVQHVHVAEGGQAIVGNVNAPAEGVGARKKSEVQPHAQLALCTRRCDAAPGRSGAGFSAERRRCGV
jgi:hypothetical protein